MKCLPTIQRAKISNVGLGTGLLSELFLKNGDFVFGVEPNVEMRTVAENRMRAYTRFVRASGRGRSHET